MKTLEIENRQPKQMVADAMFEKRAIKDIFFQKKVATSAVSGSALNHLAGMALGVRIDE